MTTSARAISNGSRTSPDISTAMVQKALLDSHYHGRNSAQTLRGLIQVEDTLCAEEGLGVVCPRGASTLFHLVQFEADAYHSMLRHKGGLVFLKRLSNLADRGCYYLSQKLYKAPLTFGNVSTSPPRSLRQTSVWENKDGQLSGLLHMLRHTADGLAGELVARRHYVQDVQDVQDVQENKHENKQENKGGRHVLQKSFDPRFLIFEFITGFLLRKRQYELVTDFLKSHQKGESAVHQMIMGAGKTTVIGPLLALILADGKRLVTQVCPGPLLEMTRGEMRKKYSNIIPKRIYTLSFDRSSEDSNSVGRLNRLYEKLNNARKQRAIVCTTPEAVKSIMLKYIDFLQQVEAAPDLIRAPGGRIGSALSAKASEKAKDYKQKQQMSDVLKKIIGLWSKKEHGVALLDEVDLLLHPLKSGEWAVGIRQ